MASFKDCTTWLEKALKLQEKMLGDSFSRTFFSQTDAQVLQ